MSEPERPWFRFHLLTAVPLALSAGAMLWLNIEVTIFHPTIFMLVYRCRTIPAKPRSVGSPYIRL